MKSTFDSWWDFFWTPEQSLGESFDNTMKEIAKAGWDAAKQDSISEMVADELKKHRRHDAFREPYV